MISVCLCTYNGELFIKAQVDSILCQLRKDDELIISDDGSKDNTISILENFKDPRIKILHNQHSLLNYKGYYNTLYKVSRNFENALMHASGDYIFLSDQDDIWAEDKIKIISNSLGTYDLVVHNCMIFDSDTGNNLGEWYKFVKPSKNLLRTLYKSSFHGCTMAFNKKIKDIVLPFPQIPIGHDTWIGINSVTYGNVYFEEKKLLKYRKHSTNVSGASRKKSSNSLSFKLFYRLLLLLKIIELSLSKRIINK